MNDFIHWSEVLDISSLDDEKIIPEAQYGEALGIEQKARPTAFGVVKYELDVLMNTPEGQELFLQLQQQNKRLNIKTIDPNIFLPPTAGLDKNNNILLNMEALDKITHPLVVTLGHEIAHAINHDHVSDKQLEQLEIRNNSILEKYSGNAEFQSAKENFNDKIVRNNNKIIKSTLHHYTDIYKHIKEYMSVERNPNIVGEEEILKMFHDTTNNYDILNNILETGNKAQKTYTIVKSKEYFDSVVTTLRNSYIDTSKMTVDGLEDVLNYIESKMNDVYNDKFSNPKILSMISKEDKIYQNYHKSLSKISPDLAQAVFDNKYISSVSDSNEKYSMYIENSLRKTLNLNNGSRSHYNDDINICNRCEYIVTSENHGKLEFSSQIYSFSNDYQSDLWDRVYNEVEISKDDNKQLLDNNYLSDCDIIKHTQDEIIIQKDTLLDEAIALIESSIYDGQITNEELNKLEEVQETLAALDIDMELDPCCNPKINGYYKPIQETVEYIGK